MFHLRSVAVASSARASRAGFPWTVPAIRSLRELEFTTPVTILVGENGSGKSTLLEALAIAARAVTAGSTDAHDDETLDGVRALAAALRLSWTRRTHRGFYMRAEDFFGYARRLHGLRAELERGLEEVEAAYADSPALARDLARSPYLKELGALRARYGDGLDSQSHGESFLRFFQERFVPGGVYFLDEPEAPLSPSRQLGFLALLRQMVAEDAQVVMATHSPILLAFPGATILSFDRDPVEAVGYEDLEHVTLTRQFLADPGAFLRHL